MEEKRTWFDAHQRCFWIGGYLADMGIEADPTLQYNGGPYWTGLSRVRQTWTDGKDISLKHNEDILIYLLFFYELT